MTKWSALGELETCHSGAGWTRSAPRTTLGTVKTTERDQSKAAFDLLWGAHRSGRTIASLPEDVRPRTRAEGYAVQRHLEDHTSEVVGWKIAATSKAGQEHICVDGPLAGRVLAERVVGDGGTIALTGNSMCLIEQEFAFRMSTTVLPRDTAYSMDEVLEHAGELLLSLEVPSSRFQDVTAVGAAQIIADNACASDLVVAPAADQDWKGADLAGHEVRATSSSGSVHEGIGNRVLGDPKAALAWLVNELSGHGITLHAGQLVTTGTCIAPMPIAAGETVTGDYGALGRISITFTE